MEWIVGECERWRWRWWEVLCLAIKSLIQSRRGRDIMRQKSTWVWFLTCIRTERRCLTVQWERQMGSQKHWGYIMTRLWLTGWQVRFGDSLNHRVCRWHSDWCCDEQVNCAGCTPPWPQWLLGLVAAKLPPRLWGKKSLSRKLWFITLFYKHQFQNNPRIHF